MALFNYECDEVKRIIEEVSPNYPQLTTYEKEWLYFHKYGYIPGVPVELEYETVSVNPNGSVSNAIPHQYKRAILKGQTLNNMITLDTKKEYVLEQNGSSIIMVHFILIDGFENDVYTIRFEISNMNIIKPNSEWVVYLYTISSDGNADNTSIKSLIKNGIVSFVYTPYRKLKTEKWFKICLHTDSGVGSTITIKNVMVLKGDHTQKDIPYFEGMQSVKMPVLTTSNEDGTKTNILTVNEDVTLRSNGDVYDELNLLNGRLTQRIDENNEVLAQAVVKTVDLAPLNTPYEGTNYYHLTANIPCEAILEVPVVSTGKQTLEEINN